MSALSLFSKTKPWVSSFFACVSYYALTIFLFTKSDIKTTLIPVVCFAFGTAPLSKSHPISHGLQAILWFYVHLLGFNLCNQARQEADNEDKCNKPWRPLPSGRISLESAMSLKYAVVIFSIILSTFYGLPAVYASEGLWLFTFAYHDLHLEENWIGKSVINGAGYGCLALGTVVVASESRQVDFIQVLALLTIMTVISTTIHVQDFEDRIGDAQVGRRTLILLHPRFARCYACATLISWTFYLCKTWELPQQAAIFYAAFALFLCARWLNKTTIKDDGWSYVLYNVCLHFSNHATFTNNSMQAWLAIAFLLPGYWRLFKEPAGPATSPLNLEFLLPRNLCF
ncbi:UbiA prenyltransferase family-domain-containing protein [Crepidotus variabilis]|uniref:UbiA prenyltransferase family-domain-containing protein n=1 Tax=Crepidotus variabilis TaxID=179855 RepID=A0A9P6EJN0_9AGAR|nr:UbiA prenyltransferase family-domain-containing protein [Crepidotus variabilis]